MNAEKNEDLDLTKEDLLEFSSLVHLKFVELRKSLKPLKTLVENLEKTRYKEDRTLKLARELYETQSNECERYSKLYKKIVNLYLIKK